MYLISLLLIRLAGHLTTCAWISLYKYGTKKQTSKTYLLSVLQRSVILLFDHEVDAAVVQRPPSLLSRWKVLSSGVQPPPPALNWVIFKIYNNLI